MNTRFDIVATPLQGLNVLQRKPLGDTRGSLERMFCADDLQPVLGKRHIVQINRTLTAKRGTVRGMHLQYPPHAEMKFVSCLRGKVFDVAIDLRRGSPTFLQWHAQVLSADNHMTLAIPEGFAHGLQTLSDDCELLYLHTATFRPEAEGGFNAQDPLFDIHWPEPIVERSARDEAHPMLTQEFAGVSV